MIDEPELCYHRQNATVLQLYHSSEPVVLATQWDISGKISDKTKKQMSGKESFFSIHLLARLTVQQTKQLTKN